MSRIHLRKRALKKPKRDEEETSYEFVRRAWSLCRTGDAIYGVLVTEVPGLVDCKNCLRMMEEAEDG